MPGKFGVSPARAKDNSDQAATVFVVTNAAITSVRDVVAFMSAEGVRLVVKSTPSAVRTRRALYRGLLRNNSGLSD